MPGSKTYTSNKINELLEMEFLDGVSKMEKQSAKKLSNTFFFEVLKISLSLFITAVVECLSLKGVLVPKEPAVESMDELIVKMEMIIFMIVVFVFSYAFIHLLVAIGKWLFSAFVNKRILPSEKVKAHINFHKKIVNHIYLGISFENKYSVYILPEEAQKNEIIFDLAANYLSQAVYYFELAKNELSELIPTGAKRNSYLDWRNAEYLDSIGFPIINITLISGQRSLRRLLRTKEKILDAAKSINAEANAHSIKQGYSDSLESLFDQINSYADCYQSFLSRVADLQNLLRSK